MRIFISILGIIFSVTLYAQKASIRVIPLKSEIEHPWTKLEPNRSEGDFQFAIVTDRTGGHRPGVFMDAVNKLNLLQPEFVMSVGDLIEGYTENEVELKRQWNEFDGFVNKLEMPFFYVPGNHDITNQVMEDLWKERLGDTYYAFSYKDVLFLCLNSEDQKRGAGRGTVSDEQYEWVKETLDKHQDAKYTLVFMHQPLWTQEDTERWKDVEALLKDRPHNVFTGHYHRYTKYDRNNGKYFVLATTGGGSSLRGPGFGEFDHVVWVTMKESGPIVANLLLEGIWDENVVTEELRSGIEKLQDVSPFQFELLYKEEMAQNNGEFSIKISNDQDVPMNVRIEPGVNFDLAIFTEKEEIEIAPNSVERVDMKLQTREGKEFYSAKPVDLTAIVSFGADENTGIELPFTYGVKPIKKWRLKKLDSRIKVDGNLKDWQEMTYEIDMKGNGNDHASYSIAYDDKMLYVAADVKDDEIIVYGSGSPWRQDYIGLCLNAETAEKAAMSVGKNWYRNEMYFLQTPETADKVTRTWKADALPEGSKFACKANENGYSFEWAIPLSYLEEKQGEEWQSLRFNIMIGDKDSGDEDPRMYFWQPNWRGDANYLGSGMFFRN